MAYSEFGFHGGITKQATSTASEPSSGSRREQGARFSADSALRIDPTVHIEVFIAAIVEVGEVELSIDAQKSVRRKTKFVQTLIAAVEHLLANSQVGLVVQLSKNICDAAACLKQGDWDTWSIFGDLLVGVERVLRRIPVAIPVLLDQVSGMRGAVESQSSSNVKKAADGPCESFPLPEADAVDGDNSFDDDSDYSD